MPSSEISIRPPTHSPSVAFESAAAAPGTASVKVDAVAFGYKTLASFAICKFLSPISSSGLLLRQSKSSHEYTALRHFEPLGVRAIDPFAAPPKL
jgi:hypothetical protein